MIWCKFAVPSENSSVGRAQPCQGWGREFESRFSLKKGRPVDVLFLFPWMAQRAASMALAMRNAAPPWVFNHWAA